MPYNKSLLLVLLILLSPRQHFQMTGLLRKTPFRFCRVSCRDFLYQTASQPKSLRVRIYRAGRDGERRNKTHLGHLPLFNEGILLRGDLARAGFGA